MFILPAMTRFASRIARMGPALLWLLVAVTTVNATKAVEVGQTKEEVLVELGDPEGVVKKHDDSLLLFYPQGEITLRNNRVAKVDLLSEEEYIAKQERLEKQREERRRRKAQRAAAREERGQALKKTKKQSPDFKGLPAKDRLAYWRNFQTHYPEVDVSEEIGLALKSREVELEEGEVRERIERLETQLAQAKEEAADAREEARELRNELKELKTKKNTTTWRYESPRAPTYLYPRSRQIIIHPNGKVLRHDGIHEHPDQESNKKQGGILNFHF
ncbi:MAG: hypothetical protein ACLFS4_03565 [Opitutales bacterium]